MDPLFLTRVESWHSFYALLANAAGTLLGLMFLAVTFGSSLVTPETAGLARAFTNPTFTHFLQVLLISAVMLIPGLPPAWLGIFLLVMCGLRVFALIDVVQHVRRAHRTAGDVELSDWMLHVVFPLAVYALYAVTGVGFLTGRPIAFGLLAAALLAQVTIGVEGAWELVIWMAPKVNQKREGAGTEDSSGKRR
jgi:hypothetical protein